MKATTWRGTRGEGGEGAKAMCAEVLIWRVGGAMEGVTWFCTVRARLEMFTYPPDPCL